MVFFLIVFLPSFYKKKLGLKSQTISQHTLNTEHMHNPLHHI